MSIRLAVLGFVAPIFVLSIESARADYTLTVSEATVFPGETIRACWTASPAGQQDWVAMAVVGAPNTVYMGWYYTNAESSGCRDYTAPFAAGQYEFRYFPNNLYVRTATSEPFTVQCNSDSNCADSLPCTADKCIEGACVNRVFEPSDIELSATPNPAPRGGELQVCWNIPEGMGSISDWLSLSLPGSADGAYVGYVYTNGETNGCRSMVAPSNVGEYELRFHVQGNSCVVGRGDELLAVCDAVADPGCTCYRNQDCNDQDPCSTDSCFDGVCSHDHPPYEKYSISTCIASAPPGFPLTTCWSSPPNRPFNDWVGLFPSGGTPHSYTNWTGIGGAPNHCWSAPAPVVEGLYEFRYQLVGGDCDTATSSEIEVCTECSPARLDVLDAFGACLSGPGGFAQKGCESFDLDCDGRTDMRDTSLFQRFFDPDQ